MRQPSERSPPDCGHLPNTRPESVMAKPYVAAARAWVQPQDPPRLPVSRGPRVEPRRGRAGHERALAVAHGVPGRVTQTPRIGRRTRRVCPTSPPWLHQPMGGARRARRRRGWVARRARSGAVSHSNFVVVNLWARRLRTDATAVWGWWGWLPITDTSTRLGLRNVPTRPIWSERPSLCGGQCAREGADRHLLDTARRFAVGV